MMKRYGSSHHDRHTHERKPMPNGTSSRLLRWFLAAGALLILLASGLDPVLAASPAQPKSFDSPNQAAQALYDAAKAKDQKAVVEILGPAYRKWILSGDTVQDAQRVERFVAAYAEKATVANDSDDKATLAIGNDDYPFPFPIVKTADKWSFDPDAGRDELLNRAIGRNELNTIQTILAIVDAQREYARRDRSDNGVPEYARKFRSRPGKKDGLFWVAQQGEPESPLGPLVAGAVSEGYSASKSGPVPFHGYHFRILTRQGDQAAGGAYPYVLRGKMVGGFAVLAYPARYGISGIKTFTVNHDGVVYETDLGLNTGRAALKIRSFNPDSRWKEVETPPG